MILLSKNQRVNGVPNERRIKKNIKSWVLGTDHPINHVLQVDGFCAKFIVHGSFEDLHNWETYVRTTLFSMLEAHI